MRLSRKYGIPGEIALVYDFVNSLDVRQFVVHGVQHVIKDELATPDQLSQWMVVHGLLAPGTVLSKPAHLRALRLRSALRSFIQLQPGEARRDPAVTKTLNEVAGQFPLIVSLKPRGTMGLVTARQDGVNALAEVLVALEHVATLGRLDRLKMCASAECRWVFYDRSKPSSRRWCMATLCGNREKTRAYRRRHQRDNRAAATSPKR